MGIVAKNLSEITNFSEIVFFEPQKKAKDEDVSWRSLPTHRGGKHAEDMVLKQVFLPLKTASKPPFYIHSAMRNGFCPPDLILFKHAWNVTIIQQSCNCRQYYSIYFCWRMYYYPQAFYSEAVHDRNSTDTITYGSYCKSSMWHFDNCVGDKGQNFLPNFI